MDARGRAALRVALSETRAVYALADKAYASFSCPGSAACCQLAKTRREPWLWPTEWKLVVGRALRDRGALPHPRPDGACPFLDERGARCTVYEDRPFGCRTFFCEQARRGKEPIEAMALLSSRLEQLNLRVEPELAGPRRLLELLEEVVSR